MKFEIRHQLHQISESATAVFPGPVVQEYYILFHEAKCIGKFATEEEAREFAKQYSTLKRSPIFFEV